MNTIKNLRLVGYATLVFAIIVDVWFEQYARGSVGVRIDGYSVWIAAPFILMVVAIAIANSLRSLKVVFVLSVLLALSSLFIYWHALFIHVDAQGSLVFVFLPLYQLVAVAAVLLAVIVVRIRARLAANNGLESDALKTTRASR